MRKHGKTARRAGIAAVAGKDVANGAFSPVGRRGVDGFLDIGPVEVDLGAVR